MTDLLVQVLQRHLVSGSLFSIGIANNDQQNTLLGNLPEDQLDFTVSKPSKEVWLP